MKILRLRLSTLNALRGQNAVDFTQPPLANSGLFAITGQTGAGKTTLLDAITLALYGRVARYGSTPNPDAVMSRHTGECSAEVEFSCATGTFRSVWQLQRARKKSDGNLQQAKRRVIALPAETIIAESIKDSDLKILELTGLDYDRFLRSVLLAQGDFAAFLKAGPKERTDLLQEVTGTALYQDISQAAYRRAASSEQAHDLLLREHQAVPVLDPDERTRHETTQSEQAHRLSELAGELKTLSSRIANVGRWREFEVTALHLTAEQTEHQENCHRATPSLIRLDRHETAAPFLSDLNALDRLTTEQAKDAATLLEIETKLPELVRLRCSAETATKQTLIALGTEEARQVQLRSLWAEVTELDKSLAIARETWRLASEQHAGFEKHTVTLTTTCGIESAVLQKLAQAHAAAIAWLTEHAIEANLPQQLPELQAAQARWSAAENASVEAQHTLAQRLTDIERLTVSIQGQEEQLPPLQRALDAKSKDVEAATVGLESAGEKTPLIEIERLRDSDREQRIALEKLVADAARLRAHTTELAARQTESEQIAAELIHATEATTNRQERGETLTKLLISRRDIFNLAEKMQSLEGHRAQLHDGTPCPLCGAVDHPYSAGLPSEDMAAIRKNVTDAEVELKIAQHQLSESGKRHAALVADEKRLLVDRNKQTAEHAALLMGWNILASPFGLADQFGHESAIVEKLRIAQAGETRRSAQMSAVRAAEQALQQATTVQQNAQTAINRVQIEVEKQSALAAQAREQVPAAEAALASHRQCAANEKVVFDRLVTGFAPVPLDRLSAAALLVELKTRAAAFTHRHTDAQSLHAELGAQQSKTEALRLQLVAATSTAADSFAKVAVAKADSASRADVRRARFGDRAVAEAQREADATLKQTRVLAEAARGSEEKIRQGHTSAIQERDRLTRTLTAQTIERESMTAQLSAAARLAGFADTADLRAALLPAPDAAVLVAQRKFLEERRISLATQTATLAAQRAALPPSASEDSPHFAALQTELAARESENAGLQGTAGEIRAILKNDAEQRARQATFAVQIEAAHRDYVRWDKLRALIGSADGSLFARFAQGLTLDRLTILANRHLVELNPRYSIRRAAEGEAGDLELEIVDHYQADVSRPMQSLSGGESFLVSLALALGLSELASGHTSIESLFIDEGFGSLDPETLEIAMSALENLQARGKTIGVISHVPAMQERIAAQIRVTKESNGCSRIDVVA